MVLVLPRKVVCTSDFDFYCSDCEHLVAKTIEKFGKLDYLVNNAGTTKYAFDHSNMEALSSDDFLDIYKTNVIGPYNIIKHAKPFLLQSTSPGIVNVASIAAVTGEYSVRAL